MQAEYGSKCILQMSLFRWCRYLFLKRSISSTYRQLSNKLKLKKKWVAVLISMMYCNKIVMSLKSIMQTLPRSQDVNQAYCLQINLNNDKA